MEGTAGRSLSSSRAYTVAWLAALPLERAAAEILLDEQHVKPRDYTPNVHDTNSYTWGRTGEHNIVIASLPSGQYGTVVTADMTAGLRCSHPHIRVGLFVGIAAGVTGEREEPNEKLSIERDIRLGDIAVSSPDKANGGVVQHDLYKATGTTNGNCGEMKGFSNAPPKALLSALAALQTKHMYEDSRVTHHLTRFDKNEKTRAFRYPGILNAEDTVDRDESDSGDSDDEDRLRHEDPLRVAIAAKRATLRSGTKFRKLKRRTEPAIHYGTIASGNTLVKDRVKRDDIISRLKAGNVEPICLEMEAAGVMGTFPSLVIRGICDYGDGEKNDAWQKYAAATAAAFAKEFLEYLDAEEVEQEPPIRQVEKLVEQLTEKVDKHAVDYRQGQMHNWLSAPDPSKNLNNAKSLRHPDTGLWLLQSEQYKDWRGEIGSSLWLHGLAGCGKTVLSSTIIEDLQQRSSDNIVLYFFFDFNDADKQTFEKMLRSLISQIYQHCRESQEHLDRLYTAYGGGKSQPDTKSLITVLNSMMAESEKVHVVLDALDECNRKTRKGLLDWLDSLPRDKLRLVLTSRKEYDIEVSLTGWIPPIDIVSIQNDPVDEDIRAVIRSRLDADKDLQRWQFRTDVREKIETELMKKADGMFRWAVCQLDALRTCLDLPSLRMALSSLPRDLDETYGRILVNIEREGYKRNAIRLLQFLIYSERPLLLQEAVDAIAVDPDHENCENSFREENRMPNPNEIVRYCSSLVRLTSRVADSWDDDDIGCIKGPTILELQLAHFSVKEYLISPRVEETFKEPLGDACSRVAIVEVSTSYMLAISHIDHPDEGDGQKFPLLRLSTTSWADHARRVEACQEKVVHWSHELLVTGAALELCLRGPSLDYRLTRLLNGPFESYGPLYFASVFGLPKLATRLIDEGGDVNAQCGEHGDALQAASERGHRAVVQLLLDRGAEVNAEGGFYGCALQAASSEGDIAVVQLLLNRGANVSAEGGRYGYALHAVSFYGHIAVVQLLLDRGADVNAEGGFYGCAL